MASPKILISGSGIAGSVFAFWILRAYPDAQVTIVEYASTPRLTGASVDIRNKAVDIIKLMGVEQEIRDHTTNEKGVHCVQKDGSVSWTLGQTGRTDVQSVTSEFEIFRGALAQIFLNPIRDKVRMIFSDSVESFTQHDNYIEVTLKNSRTVEKYDLLVAADGIHSRIRGQILDAPPRDQILDEGCHAAYFSIKRDLLEGGQFAKWYNSEGGRIIFLRPDPDPRGRTRGHLVNVSTSKDVEKKKRLDDALAQGNAAYMDVLEDLFKDAGWIAPEVLKGMRGSDDFYCSLFAQVRSPSLCDGRVVLLGDAGYATPGIGTSLAIMGAYTLAGEILRHDGDVRGGSKAYEELMLPFVKSQQRGAGTMQLGNPQTEWGIYFRNTIMRVATNLLLDRIVITGAAWLGFTEKKLKTPDYQWPPQ